VGDRERGPFIVTRPVILCIDDEDLGLEIRKIVLEREGFTVLTAKDGTAGLAMLDTEPIEAVILDFAMPGINGGQVAAIVRQRKPHMPILMLSAYVALPEDVMRVVTATATKGDGAFTLVEKLKELLQFNPANTRAIEPQVTPGVTR
jgi:DNA-binding response OmpR family regulator